MGNVSSSFKEKCSSGSNKWVLVQPEVNKGSPEEENPSDWSPVMDGIVPLPSAAATEGNKEEEVNITTNVGETHPPESEENNDSEEIESFPSILTEEKKKIAEDVNAQIESVLYGPSKKKRLPACEEICPQEDKEENI